MNDIADIRATNAWIGSPVARVEDARLLRGQGTYVADLKRPEMLHAAIVRSPVAHGRIRSVDASAALAMPGVVAVITATDVARELGAVPVIQQRQEALSELEPYYQPVIAETKVRYVGEPVAVVVARDPALAEDALDAVTLDIESLPVVADRAASAKSETLLFDGTASNCAVTLTATKGNANAAFAAAPYTRRERFRVHRHTAVPMETRGLLAEWDAAQCKLFVSGAAKVPFRNRRALARQMRMAETDIEMVQSDVGGGFGVRGEFYPEDFLIPFAARLTRRPVKWIEDRREHFIATNHARDAECELEIACDRDGTILALRGRAQTDAGAYVRTNGVTPARNMSQVATGPYRIPHVRMEVSLMLTNKTPVGTYRGPGRFETDFFRERLLDIVAGDLGIDRVEIRRRNFIAAGEMPYALATVQPLDGKTAIDSGDYQVTLDRCLAEFDWAGKTHLDGRLIDGRYHGLGIGCYIEGGASGPAEGARLVVEPDGTVSVYTGSSSVGQGVETVCAQIAADTLGMPMERIRGVYHGSTAFVREGYGSFSSRSVVMGGSAIVTVARQLLERIRELAAARLGCAPAEVEILDGCHVLARRGKSITLAELASAHAMDGGISAEGSFSSSKRTYSYGAHAAHVAVDPATGRVEVLDYVAVEDVGRIINPHTLHGQALGAIVQGLGAVLLEELLYDDEGQLRTGTLADYLMPTACECPNIRVVALEQCPSPNNPLGAKGAGEGGMIPVGGLICNAVAAALAPLGIVPRELPLSPPRVWTMIEEVRTGTRAT
ncbi:MAG TPA: xanthine dehydrogenase family protein molybdopterin-binding subunit [Burkholderiales bacterium]|nr:xanthine dehydrogenase family protein molybdopterin-binding subunit [Burkholderiales bacterium]